ncbi:MAG TPA: hypothetical protein ENI76_08940 [Ignavibacteria bacterium]|nr:hypothetical protein [Ignavibacteria bacterium]
MSNMTQGIIGSIIVATIVGLFSYVFIVNKNEILIEVLGDKITTLQTELSSEKEKSNYNFQKNYDAITDLKVLIASTLQSRNFVSINAKGVRTVTKIPPLESAVIISAANVIDEIKNVSKSEDIEKAKIQLEKAQRNYETLLTFAKEQNPNIEADLKSFSQAKVVVAQQDKALVNAHKEIGNLNKTIKRTTGVSIKDIKEHGIAGGKNSEVNKAGRAIGKVFGW